MLQLSKGKDRKKREGKSKVTPVVAPTGSVGASELAAAATSAMPNGTTILYGADLVDAESAVFSLVQGHQICNPAVAGLPETNTQAGPEGEHHNTHILTNATRINAKFAVFSIVGGNQYGTPQPHVN